MFATTFDRSRMMTTVRGVSMVVYSPGIIFRLLFATGASWSILQRQCHIWLGNYALIVLAVSMQIISSVFIQFMGYCSQNIMTEVEGVVSMLSRNGYQVFTYMDLILWSAAYHFFLKEIIMLSDYITLFSDSLISPSRQSNFGRVHWWILFHRKDTFCQNSNQENHLVKRTSFGVWIKS